MDLKNEYLEKNIKEKLFKHFKSWNKEDFHFLLSLLNYPTYYSLGLIILTNLKNWILYGSGEFFYKLETIESILKKHHFNYDHYQECIHKDNKKEIHEKEENIKININKKDKNIEDNFEKDEQFIRMNDNCEFVFGDIFSVDIFSFGFWVILGLLFLVIKSFQEKPYEPKNPFKTSFNIPFELPKKENEKEIKNNFDLPLNKKELINKVIDYFIGNKNMFFE